jgi:ABC-2 type transport system permease protein
VSALLRAELLKLRTTRTFVALVAAALLLSLLIVVLTVLLTDEFSEQEAREVFTADLSSLFILVLGIMGLAGEWRHRTITGTILAAPERIRLLIAKVLAYAAAGALLSLIVTVAIIAVGSLLLSVGDKTTVGISDLADVLWRNLLVAALLGAVGVCVGGLVRNQVVAIVAVLITSFAVEPALMGLAPDVAKYGPLLNAPNGIIGINPFGDEKPLDEAVALLVMLGWIGALFALTAVLLRRRDLV